MLIRRNTNCTDILEQVLPKEIWEKGYSLKSMGLYEQAWKSDQFMEVLGILEKLPDQVAIILGGDVYKIHEGKILLTYDFWGIKLLKTEPPSAEEFENSYKLARKFVIDYIARNTGDFLFTMVPRFYIVK